MRRRDAFVCDFDGKSKVTEHGTIEIPRGWIVGQATPPYRPASYWCSFECARKALAGPALGVPRGGRTTTWEFTDDHDGTVAIATSVDPPPGWVALRGVTATGFAHFASPANAAAWIAVHAT